MKKFKMNQQIKWVVVVILLVLNVGVGILCYQETQKAETKTEEKVLYNYSINTEARYAVNLLPNTLYEEEKMEEDKVYLAQLIKSMNTFFTTSIEASEVTKISGDYEITAQVASYMVEEKVKKDIWHKNYVLVPKQVFEEEGTSYQIERSAEVDYKGYDAFAKAIAEATGVNNQTELRIKLSGKIQLETPHGTVEKPIDATILMPLGSSYFTISKEGIGKVEDSIKKEVTITLPPNKQKIILYGVLAGGLMVSALALLIFTGPLTEEDKRRKRIQGLMNNYGSRMVGVDTIDETRYTTRYTVSSLEDLIKIADEIEKPVLYCTSKELLDRTKFYVMQEDILYTYSLEVKEIVEKNNIGVEVPVETIEWKLNE